MDAYVGRQSNSVCMKKGGKRSFTISVIELKISCVDQHEILLPQPFQHATILALVHTGFYVEQVERNIHSLSLMTFYRACMVGGFQCVMNTNVIIHYHFINHPLH